MRKLILGIAVAALTVGGAAVSHEASASPAAKAAKAGIGWGPCTDGFLQQMHAQCAMLRVPLNYRQPAGATIQLAVSRIAHTAPDAQYQGVILTNPGGPGGSGLDFSARLIQSLQKEGLTNGAAAAADYDWIGFDPRGVGSSLPALTCEPGYFSADRPSYDPVNTKIWLARAHGYATACGKDAPALLAHMTTADNARDMDSIRAALGVAQISYYGYSYGTYLGQVYSTLFPSHVRRLIMDSNVDPRRVWYNANLDQDTAFNRNLEIFFGWVAKYGRFFHLGTTEQAVQARYASELTRLLTHPGGGTIGPDEWTDAFQQAAYYQPTWIALGLAFDEAVNHNSWTSVIGWYQQADSPGNDNGNAVYNAVECTDGQWPLSWAKWAHDNTEISKKAPFETWENAWLNAPCRYWPARPGTPVRIDGSRIASALLIDETLDGATPFTGSLEVRHLFPTSVLLAEPGGTTHADSLTGDACVDNTVANYLALGQLPQRQPGNGPDTTCAPHPVPVP